MLNPPSPPRLRIPRRIGRAAAAMLKYLAVVVVFLFLGLDRRRLHRQRFGGQFRGFLGRFADLELLRRRRIGRRLLLGGGRLETGALALDRPGGHVPQQQEAGQEKQMKREAARVPDQLRATHSMNRSASVSPWYSASAATCCKLFAASAMTSSLYVSMLAKSAHEDALRLRRGSDSLFPLGPAWKPDQSGQPAAGFPGLALLGRRQSQCGHQ